jgi:hypothetical protein
MTKVEWLKFLFAVADIPIQFHLSSNPIYRAFVLVIKIILFLNATRYEGVGPDAFMLRFTR